MDTSQESFSLTQSQTKTSFRRPHSREYQPRHTMMKSL